MSDFLSEQEKKVLDVDNRRRLYLLINGNPGIHAREVERKSQLPSGTARYHLNYLVRKELVNEVKEGNKLRYFSKSFSHKNEKLMGFLRQQSVRHILLYILAHDNCSHADVASAVNISPSTVSWHLRKLTTAGITSSHSQGKSARYTVQIDRQELVNLLITQRQSFLDAVVDNVIEMWETR